MCTVYIYIYIYIYMCPVCCINSHLLSNCVALAGFFVCSVLVFCSVPSWTCFLHCITNKHFSSSVTLRNELHVFDKTCNKSILVYLISGEISPLYCAAQMFFMKRGHVLITNKMHLWTIYISWCHYHGWVLFDSIFGECDNSCFSVLKTTRCSTPNCTTKEGNVTLIEWTQLLVEFPVKCAYMINRNTHDVFVPPEDGRVTWGILKPWHRDCYPN